MTYNVYVGTGAKALLSVQNLSQVPQVAAAMYENIIASDFPERAAAIAKSIKTYQPHLVGLQETERFSQKNRTDNLSYCLCIAYVLLSHRIPLIDMPRTPHYN